MFSATLTGVGTASRRGCEVRAETWQVTRLPGPGSCTCAHVSVSGDSSAEGPAAQGVGASCPARPPQGSVPWEAQPSASEPLVLVGCGASPALPAEGPGPAPGRRGESPRPSTPASEGLPCSRVLTQHSELRAESQHSKGFPPFISDAHTAHLLPACSTQVATSLPVSSHYLWKTLECGSYLDDIYQHKHLLSRSGVARSALAAG